MKYAEAMEFSRLLDFDPSVAFADDLKRATAAEEAFKAQYAFEATLGAFVDDEDTMREENVEIATEALEAVKNALSKVANWFKTLFMKFQTFVRGITFKAASKAVDRTMKKDGESAGMGVLVMDDEECGNVEETLAKAGISFKIPRSPATGKGNLDTNAVAKLARDTIAKGTKVNADLAAALKNPGPDTNVQQMNEDAKAAAKAIKVCTSMLNRAAKADLISVKGIEKGAKQAEKLRKNFAKKQEKPAQ